MSSFVKTLSCALGLGFALLIPRVAEAAPPSYASLKGKAMTASKRAVLPCAAPGNACPKELTFPDLTIVQWIQPFGVSPPVLMGKIIDKRSALGLPSLNGLQVATLLGAVTGLDTSTNTDPVLPSATVGGSEGWQAFVGRQEYRQFVRQEPLKIKVKTGAGGVLVVDSAPRAIDLITYSPGWTPIPLSGFHAGDGQQEESTEDVKDASGQVIGVRRHYIGNTRVGELGQIVQEIFVGQGVARIHSAFDYIAYADGRYEITVNAGYMPSVGVWVGKTSQSVRLQTQDDLASFMFERDDSRVRNGFSFHTSGKL